MGGFAALSNSHLASSVMVFGPQTDLWLSVGFSHWLLEVARFDGCLIHLIQPLAKDLTISHLRPGFDPDHLSRTHRLIDLGVGGLRVISMAYLGG